MSQKAKILKHLQGGHAITPLTALGVFRVYRLSDVVFKLRNDGWDVTSEIKRDANGSTYAEYRLRNPYNLFNQFGDAYAWFCRNDLWKHAVALNDVVINDRPRMAA